MQRNLILVSDSLLVAAELKANPKAKLCLVLLYLNISN